MMRATWQARKLPARWWLLLAALLLPVAAVAQPGEYDWTGADYLAPGVQYVAARAEAPRPMDLHCVRVDTHTPGLYFRTIGRDPDWIEGYIATRRQTTRGFLRQAREESHPMVVAVNADAFSPWPAPNRPMLTRLLGLAVSEGVLVWPASGTPSLLIDDQGRVSMATTTADTDLTQVRIAVSGFGFCLAQGAPIPSGDDLHPRTGFGLSEDSRFVLLLTIDGRRPGSLGATTEEVGAWLRHFGAYTGINMDGGGSTTLVRWNPAAEPESRAQVLNFPGGGFVPTERHVGNSLGVCVPHLHISAHPAAAEPVAGSDHRLHVQAVDATGRVRYQWFKDGRALPRARESVLNLGRVTEADSGVYWCQVRDDYLTLRSESALVTIRSRS